MAAPRVDTILTGSARSLALSDVWRARHRLQHMLAEPKAWHGFRARDAAQDHDYERLVCGFDLHFDGGQRRYRVAAHSFARVGAETVMHDHVRPLAVWPFDPAHKLGAVLYEMPWEYRVDGERTAWGCHEVRAGHAYAIEQHREVFHAVKSLAPHFSMVFASLDTPAYRPGRQQTSELDQARTDALRVRVHAAFAAMVAALEALPVAERRLFV